MNTRRVAQVLFSVIAAGEMGLLVAVMPGQSQAQAEQAATKPKVKTTGVEIEEVTVTARKREEKVQEVPVSVSAITSETLEQFKPQSLQDLAGYTPNLNITTQPSAPHASNIYIRGLGYADVEKTQSPSVGVMVDGIVMGTSNGQIVDTFDVQQVEVDRGPQGLFEGKNTTGGLIKITRSRPTMDWGFKGGVSYGNYDEILLRGVGNIPLIKDVVGLKLGGTFNKRNGFYDNLYGGVSDGEVKAYTSNAALLVKPTLPGRAGELFSNIEGLFIFDYNRDRSEIPQPAQFADDLAGKVSGLPGNPNNLGPHEITNDFLEHAYLDYLRGSADIKFDTPIGRIASISGYFGTMDDQWQDFDATCGTDLQGRGCNSLVKANFFLPVLHTKRTANYWQFTQELHLDSDLSKNAFVGQIPGEINLLAGVYYYTHHIQHKQLTSLATDLGAGTQYVDPLTRQDSGEKDNSVAPFVNLSWKKQFNQPFLDSISLSGGARWVYEKKEFNTLFTLVPLDNFPIVGPINQSKDWNDWLTRVDLTWGVTPYNLLYFTRAEGFRSGGFSLRGTLSEQIAGQPNCNKPGVPGTVACPENNFLSYNPENVTSYEVGTKNEFFDAAVTFNFAAFLMQIDGAQDNAIIITPGYGSGTNTYIINYQKEEIKGVEADVVVAPPFLRGFTLMGSIGYQKASIDEALIDNRMLSVGPGGTAGSSGFSDLSKSTILVWVPDFNYSITGMYKVPIGPTELSMGLTWRYVDDQAVGKLGSAGEIQKGYGLLDGNVSVNWDHYTVSIFARNMLDETYLSYTLPSVYFRYYGTPMRVAGEFAVKF